MILVANGGRSPWSSQTQTSFPIGIVAVNPTTGEQLVLSAGGLWSLPAYIAQGPDGQLYVTDLTATGKGAVIKVDPTTGTQSLLATGGFIDGPNCLVFVNGSLYVVNLGNSSGAVHNLIRLDPNTGAQVLIANCQCAGFTVPVGIAQGPGNSVYIADEPGNVQGSQMGALWKVDVDTGIQMVLTAAWLFNHPVDVAVDQSGNILVLSTGNQGNSYAGNVVRVDPATCAQSLVTSFGPDSGCDSMTVGVDGTIYIGTIGVGNVPGRVYSVNPFTGVQAIIAAGGNLSLVEGIHTLRSGALGSTSTTTAIDAPSIINGADALVKVTVTSASGVPTGSVNLSVSGGAAIPMILDSQGIATYRLHPTGGVGDYTLDATYVPTGNFLASSAHGDLVVN
jgi:hypothetical protein